MRDGRESDGKPLTRILVLGATFFMVALCPTVDMALAVFASGMAVYLLLWRLFPYEKREEQPGCDQPVRLFGNHG